MVTKNPDSESTDQDSKRHKTVSPNTPEKFGRAQERLRSMLVHGVRRIMLPVNIEQEDFSLRIHQDN